MSLVDPSSSQPVIILCQNTTNRAGMQPTQTVFKKACRAELFTIAVQLHTYLRRDLVSKDGQQTEQESKAGFSLQNGIEGSTLLELCLFS